MKDLRHWLESDDPLKSEAPLSDAEVQRMRRAVIAARPETRASASLRWAGWLAAPVAVAVLAAIGSYVDRSQDSPAPVLDGPPSADLPVTTPRQLQFVTAGGTRIIWIFNPDFEIAGSTR